MRTHRVHVPGLVAGEVTITGGAAQHLARVLRARPGQPVTAFDGRGLSAGGAVVEVSPMRVVLRLEEPAADDVEAPLRVTLAVPLLKADKLADVVRQGTEVGVAAFAPVHTRRADVRELSPARLERLRRVASEAARQSGRSVVPEVREVVRLSDPQLLHGEPGGIVIFADPRAAMPLREAVPPTAAQVTVLTGPEGGLTPEECEALTAAGAIGVRLGARILRAETAPVAIAAALLLPDAL